jgi:hypothetical protein
MTISAARLPYGRLIVAAMAVVTAAAILWLSRGYNFYFDEWTFIQTAPDWTLTTFLQPHNEHPVMLTRLVYWTLLSTAGMSSYWPYMLVLLFLHGASAFLLFELVRRRAGDLVALGSAALLLVLGAGWENLLWAFQIAFVGSVVCGLGMLLVLEDPSSQRRLLAAVVLLTASLMFSGIGLFFGAAAAVRLALLPARRRALLWFAPVVIAFGIWYLAFGHSGTPPNPAPTTANIWLAIPYAAWGLGASVAGIFGLTGVPPVAALIVASGIVGLAWWRHRPDPVALGAVAGLIALYVLTGLTRAQLGYQQSASGRYVYVGAVFWLILLADAARLLPWRETWRPLLAACLFLACFSSSVLLFEYAVAKGVQMEREMADLQALATERSDPCLNPGAQVDPLVMPQVNNPPVYYRAVGRYGDPAVTQPIVDRSAYQTARLRLVRAGCR